MRIAILGAGNVGTTLGRGLAAAGHAITYGARSPEKGTPGHPGAATLPFAEAVAGSEAVLLTTPWAAAFDVVTAAGDFGGRPLLDVTNPIAPGFQLAYGHTDSGAEEVAKRARGAHVVKAFNVTGLENMADPRYAGRRAFMPLAGDDAGALGVARSLAADLGFDAVALSPLSRARELEPLALLWIKLAMQLGQGRRFAFGLARRDAVGGEVQSRPAATRRAITVVGTGNIGGALARAWLRAGHAVTLAVRDASSDEVRAMVGAGARAVPVEGAAAGAEVVVFATPAGAVVEAAGRLGPLAGKVVVDCTNAIGRGFTLIHGHTTSSVEELARALPGARLVRAFHQQGAETLVDPRFGAERAASFVCGDDAEARALVRGLSDDAGLDTLDAGPLATARLLEPMTILWVALSQALGTRQIALTVLRR